MRSAKPEKRAQFAARNTKAPSVSAVRFGGILCMCVQRLNKRMASPASNLPPQNSSGSVRAEQTPTSSLYLPSLLNDRAHR